MYFKYSDKYNIKKLLASSKMIYHKTPFYLRLIFWPIEKVFWFVNVLKLNLWIITGEEISSKQELAIIYAGIEENKHLMIKLAFNNSYRENYLGKIWLWKIPQKVKEKGHDCSLIITEIPWSFRLLFAKKKCFYIPCWIDGEVDTSSPIKSDSLKTDMRRIRKNKLQFEVTNALNQLHNFYYNMHLPYVTTTFGKGASIFNYDYIKSEFGKRGRYNDLLLIKKEEEYIAGILLGYTKNGIYLHDIGVKDGKFDYVKEGVLGALNYFPIIYSKEKGYKRVNFGLSRAFLKDGVLQFKKKRGMQIVDTSKKYFLIKILSKTAGVKGFFLNNPFIYMDKEKFNGAIFMGNDQSLSQEDFKRIYKDYYIKGISKLFIYRFGKIDSKMQKTVPVEFSDKITICSAECLF